VLRERLERVFGMRETGLFSQKTPAEWARHFSSVLEAAGFPGERSLDSDGVPDAGQVARSARRAVTPRSNLEGDVLLLRRFQTLEGSALIRSSSRKRRIRRSRYWACSSLQASSSTTSWVTGLTDEAWPLKSSPKSLPAARAAAQSRHSRGERRDLARARPAHHRGWKQAAGEVVFSHFTKEEDRDVLPSPLIADLPRRQSKFLPSRSCAT